MRRLLLLAMLVACKSSEEPAPATGGAVARYDVAPSGAIAWSAIPFPNDLHLGADGTIDLTTLPRDAHDEPVWQATLGLLDQRKGFCATCSVYFPIDGDVEVPSAIDAPSANDPIVLVDLEDKKLLPLRAAWNAEHHFVGVRRRPGELNLGKRKYAAALTTSIRARDGSPLRPHAGMQSARAAAVLNPAFQALAGLGVPRERIAALTTFTVDDVTVDVVAARALAHKAEKPAVVVDRVWTTDQLDALFGVPAEDVVGIRPATDGKLGALHSSVALVLTGRFRAPRVITGKGKDLGSPLRDAGGALSSGELEDVPFLMTVPKGIDVERAPVVFFHTGLTGTMANGLAIAETFARAGAIGVTTDPALHGSRAATATDKRNALRDVDGPDGLMEHDGTDVGARFLGFVGAEPNKKAWPGYVLGVMTQQTTDAFATMRALKEGDWGAVQKADPSLAGLAFDRERIGYLGLSNGSVVGMKMVIAEPAFAAAVLNVSPANLAETLFAAPGFKQVASISIAPNLQVPVPDSLDALRFDPLFDIYRWALEPMDPLALSPYVTRPLVEGPRPDLLMQHAGHDELVVPILADQLAASVGFPAIGTYTDAPVAAGALPLEGNFTINGQKLTAGSVRFPGAGHVMIGYAEEDSAWETLVMPYKQRPTKITLKNPVVAVQKQVETFYKTRFTTGRARIAAD